MTFVQSAAADPSVFHDRLLVSNPTNGTPRILDGGRQDGVKAFAQIGGTMYVGGSFTQVSESSGPTITRNHIFAFDVASGAISGSFVPQLNGKVESIQPAPDGLSVFVGGYFTTVNGQSAKRIAKISTSNGQLVGGWNANVNTGSRVMDMSIDGNRLFIGGQFTKVNNQTRTNLAALDTSTGALDASVNFTFAGTHSGSQRRIQRMDISPDGDTIVAIGNFATVNGLDRHQIVKLNVGSNPATVSNWETDRYKSTLFLDVRLVHARRGHRPERNLLRGRHDRGVLRRRRVRHLVRHDHALGDERHRKRAAAQLGGVPRRGHHMVGALDRTRDLRGRSQRWMNNPFAGDSAGPGSVPRVGAAALDPLNGLPLNWTATREPRREGVFKLYSTADGVWWGSDSCCIAGERHERLALLPVAGGTVVPPPSVFHLPNDLWNSDFSAGSVTALDHSSYNGAAFGSNSSLNTPAIDWSQTRGAFVTNGRLYYGRSDGTFRVRSFDGSSLGAESTIDLHGLNNSHFPLANVTGMFLDQGRLYYTVAGNSNLFYRYFSPSWDMTGAQTFMVNGSAEFDWGSVAGMTMVDGNIYVGRANGNLDRIGFSNRLPVGGSRTTVSGPGIDGRNWRSRGLFVF